MNHLFYRHLPPSQGGKYTGFGYTRDPPPKNQSQELIDSTLSTLASVSNIDLLFNLVCLFILINIK